MKKFDSGFLLGAATAAHQVEGNNIYSDCWAQEQMKHTGFVEPSGDCCGRYEHYEELLQLRRQRPRWPWRRQKRDLSKMINLYKSSQAETA